MKRCIVYLLITCHCLAADTQSLPIPAPKKNYSSINEALQSEKKMSGYGGPANVSWLEGGKRISYTRLYDGAAEIRSLDPRTLADSLVFNTKRVSFPGQDKPFAYTSFQWSKDSKFILFQSNFRPVWRRSGISDFYIYSITG